MQSMQYNLHFVVGSQDLYGPQVLQQVAANAAAMAQGWNAAGNLPARVECRLIVRSSDEIEAAVDAANADPNCVGIMVWMHTFSPAKMWIRGLKKLQKPLLHIHTQFGAALPWDSIDMDFMNLHQSAHGDREFGFMAARMRLNNRVIAGHWQSARLQAEMAGWIRAAIGVAVGKKLRILRISDNMRQVAVTEGDKVEAHLQFGWQVDHYGVGDLVARVEAVTPQQVDHQLEEYRQHYTWQDTDTPAVAYQARVQVALQQMLQQGGFGGFHTNFEDLQGLQQLPGLAVQDLMRQGYGFAGEGDWKTAALCRVFKAMAPGGRCSFMEDYTYHFEGDDGLALGAHMLEVCPSMAVGKPTVKVCPLGIGNRQPPARAVFECPAGQATLTAMIDLGNRFRVVTNVVDCVQRPHAMPNLPVAGVLWRPRPDLVQAAEAWITAGGAHHSVLSYELTAEVVAEYCRMLGVECVCIDQNTSPAALRQQLQLADAAF